MKHGKLETEEEAKAVREWLKEYPETTRDHTCPWFSGYMVLDDLCLRDKHRCNRLFPKLGHVINGCPCEQFGIDYVTRKAEEFVKEWEERKEL